MLIKVYDVLDTRPDSGAAFHKVGVMTRDGECQIVRWTPKQEDESKYTCKVITSMPEKCLDKLLGMFERYMKSWEGESQILRERPVKALGKTT